MRACLESRLWKWPFHLFKGCPKEPPSAPWLIYSDCLIINHSEFFIPCNLSSFFGSFHLPSLTGDRPLSAPTFQRRYNKTRCLQYPPEVPPRVNSVFRLTSLLEATLGFKSQDNVGRNHSWPAWQHWDFISWEFCSQSSIAVSSGAGAKSLVAQV